MPLVKRVTCMGTLFAFEISSSKSIGFASTEASDIIRILRKRGLYIRPLGNVLYLMVSLLTSKDDVELYLMAIRDGLNQWSDMKRIPHSFIVSHEEPAALNRLSLI